jgi:hypothetical protein
MLVALRAWLERIDYKRFTHRAEVRYLSAGLLLLGSLAYAGPTVIEQGGVPPAGSGHADVRVAMFTAVTAFLTVAGQLILLARGIVRRSAQRASYPPHGHPEIEKRVAALATTIEDAVERVALMEGRLATETNNLFVMLAQTQRMVEGMRVDASTRADYQTKKLDRITAAVEAERQNREAERQERLAAAGEISDRLDIIAGALGVAAAASLKPKPPTPTVPPVTSPT